MTLSVRRTQASGRCLGRSGDVALWTAALALSACGANTPVDHHAPVTVAVSSAPRAPTPCDLDASLRGRAPALLEEGRLDRALRVLARANERCPAASRKTWSLEVEALAEIGKYAEARALADRIDREGDPNAKGAAARARLMIDARDKVFASSAEAKKEMRTRFLEASRAADGRDPARARALYLEAWSLWRPNGQALIGAGLAAKELGDRAGAQRLFDRAIEEVARATGAKATLEVPYGYREASAVAWSGDGKLLAVKDGGHVSLMDTRTYRERLRLPSDGDNLTSFAFSPDGRTIATGLDDGTIRLSDASTGATLRTIDAKDNAILAFAPDGKTLAAAPWDNGGPAGAPVADSTIRRWDLATGTELAALVMPGGTCAVAFSPDSRSLVAGGQARTRLWDLSTGKERGGVPDFAITALAFAPDGHSFVSSNRNRAIHVWDARTLKEIRKVEALSEVSAIAFGGDGKTLASSTKYEETVQLWDVATGLARQKLVGHGGKVVGLALSPDKLSLASVSANEVRVWDTRSGAPLRALKGHAAPLTSLVFTDEHSFASGAAEPMIRLWGAQPGSVLRTLEGHSAGVSAIAVSPDRKTLASASADKTVRTWSLDSEREAHVFSGHTRAVDLVTWSADGKSLASASRDATARLWDPSSARLVRTWSNVSNATAIAFSADGRTFVAASDRRGDPLASVGLQVWDVTTGATVASFIETSATSLTFAPDGALIALGVGDGSVRLWSTRARAELRTLTGHTYSVDSLAFRPSGGVLASAASQENAVRLWDINTGRQLLAITAAADVSAVAFSTDGGTLATGAREGTIQLWSPSTGAPLLTVRAVEGRKDGYAFTPNGYIDVFGDARDIPVCRIGPQSYRFDVCEERFLVPGLLRMALSGEASYVDP